MVAQPIEDCLTPAFINTAAKELLKSGFISDEHDFAPYRETLSEHVFEIKKALRNSGHTFDLLPGFLKHPDAGYAYYIYDTTRFKNRDTAESAVKS